MKTNKNIILFITGLGIIILLTIYALLIGTNKLNVITNAPSSQLSKEKFSSECLSLLNQEKNLATPYLICGIDSNVQTIPLKSPEILRQYLATNTQLAIAFSGSNLLTLPLFNLRSLNEVVTSLSKSVHLCAYIYPDFSENITEGWGIYPKTIEEGFSKAEINTVVCTNYLNTVSFPDFVLVGQIIKKGKWYEKFKEVNFDNLKIELNLLNSETPFSDGSLGYYFLKNPLKFIPFYRVEVPLK